MLALYFAEPGSDVVRDAGPGGRMSAVNYSEAIAKALDRGAATMSVERYVLPMRLVVLPFTDDSARRAAGLRPATRGKDISFADRACLAMALETSLPIYTTDRAWADLGLPIDIRLIR